MKISKKNIVILLAFLSLIVNFIGHALKTNIMVYLSIIITTSLMLISNIEYSTYILFISLPFFNLFTPVVGTTSLYYIYVILYILKNIYQFIKKRKINNLIYKYIIFTIIIIFTMRNFFESSLMNYISWLILGLMFIFMYKNINTKLFNIIKLYTISFIISSFCGYIGIINNWSHIFPVQLHEVWGSSGVSLRFVGLTGESNSYAQIALILICFNIINIITSNNKKKIENYLYIFIIISFSLLTYSKMFIIGLVIIGALVIIYISQKNFKEGIKLSSLLKVGTVSVLISCIILVLILNNLDNEVLLNYGVRFSSKDLFTGRFDVYDYFFKFLSSNVLYMLFGIGFANYDIPWGVGKHAHNIYLECILLFGIVGFLAIFILILLKISKSFKKNNTLLLYIPLIVYLITGFSLHSMLSNYFFFIMVLMLSIFEDYYYINKINN